MALVAGAGRRCTYTVCTYLLTSTTALRQLCVDRRSTPSLGLTSGRTDKNLCRCFGPRLAGFALITDHF